MFASLFDGNVSPLSLFTALGCALLFGGAFAYLSCARTKSTRSFAVACAVLPMAVGLVVALVNGNLGVGVAIAGAFGLVRFRSAPGTAREIAVIFVGMAAGLAFGMGYVAYGAVFLLGCGAVFFLLTFLPQNDAAKTERVLRITVPETLNYTTAFDGILSFYTKEAVLEKVKTVNMGSMFRLSYRIRLKKESEEKMMLDELRTRNGNLEIVCSRADAAEGEL